MSGWPSWNLTPWRSVKVQTVPLAFGFQLVASIGFSCSAWLSSNARNSPVWASMHSPPESEIVIGLIAAAGAWVASFSVPPLVGAAAALDVPDEDEAEDELLAPPQADRITPINVDDMPITAPRRTN